VDYRRKKIAEDLDEDDYEDYGEQAEDVGRLAELRGEEKVIQVMHTVDADGNKVQKGRKTILTERDKFKNHCGNDLKNICNFCKTNTRASFKMECEDSGTFFDDECCAKYVLSQEPDFLEQMEWLEI